MDMSFSYIMVIIISLSVLGRELSLPDACIFEYAVYITVPLIRVHVVYLLPILA